MLSLKTAKFLSLAITVGLLFPIIGQAASIGLLGPSLTISVSYSTPPPTWTITVDPMNLQSFQLDLMYNSTNLTFVSGMDLAPYSGPAPTVVSPGDIRFTGSTSTPPTGEVDLFTALFTGASTIAPGFESFTAEAIGSDFVIGLDPSTGLTTTYGPSSITSATGSAVPEPSTVLLLGGGLLGIAIRFGWKRLSKLVG